MLVFSKILLIQLFLLTNLFEKEGIKILSYPRVTGDGYYESVILDIENNKIEITV